MAVPGKELLQKGQDHPAVRSDGHSLPENSPEPPQHSPAPDLVQPGPGPSRFVLKLSWISSLRVNSTEVAGRVPGVQGTQGQRCFRPGIVPGHRSSTLH